ncbi:hypothetical protein BAY59_10645 [Prauserella coralliicola]|nr:hypothetical protein BAY59_10645 [Prauserella coralliicola]
MTHPADWDVAEAAGALRAGRITSLELTEACLARVVDRDPAYGAWIRVYPDDARAAARAADAVLARGEGGPLTGVPLGLKDVIGVSGLPLTADSAVLEGNAATEDSTLWTRLRDAGMVLIGHLHCGEFANGTWGVNPWSAEFSPGGSSSGNGIALAARMIPATVGSDGRGSIRMPAAFNGVTGMKPTYGLVSTAGCVPITFSYDTLGPMARSAADCSLLLSAMAGRDPRDRTTLTQPADLGPFPVTPRPGQRPAAGIRIGIPRFPGEPMSDGISTVYERFQKDLVGLGAELVPFDWPVNPLEPEIGRLGDYVHILGAELLYIHEQFADREHLYRDDWRQTISMYQQVGSAVDYVRAQGKRAEYVATWHRIFAEHQLDAVIHPASLDELFRSAPLVEIFNSKAIDQPLEMPRMLFGCWNDANFPALAVPAGLSPTDGSPVGMQIIGTPYTDATILQLGIDIQSATGHHLEQPPNMGTAEPYQSPQRYEQHTVQPAFLRPANPVDPLIPLATR